MPPEGDTTTTQPPTVPPFIAGAPVPLERLGDLLVALRKERGLTQQALGDRLGILPEAVARNERDRYRGTGLERLVRVAKALEVQILLLPHGEGMELP